QTIILDLSQCSSTARPDASPANLPTPHFPVESGKSAAFARLGRLTGGLPDVGTDGALHRNLIRDLRSGHSGARALENRLQGAVIAVSVPCSDRLPSKYQGIDPDGAFETQGEKHCLPRQPVCTSQPPAGRNPGRHKAC